MSTTITGWKVLTHDYRSPLQGGEPLLRGELPCQLPTVALDTGIEECAAGWNFCRDLPVALRIAGLWPNGRPSRAYLVTAENALDRGEKYRTSTLTLERESTPQEVSEAIFKMSEPFGDLQAEMTNEQLCWKSALARPDFSREAVKAGLIAAFAKRELPWRLLEFDSNKEIWGAWEAWYDTDARDAWAVWTLRHIWEAWDTWAAWATFDARTAWAARDVWAVKTAWSTWDAWSALTIHCAARKGWIKHPPDLLSAGIQKAYENGLEIALPVEKDVLGWAMVDKQGR